MECAGGDAVWVGEEGRGFGPRRHEVQISALKVISCVTEARLLSVSELQSVQHKPRLTTTYFIGLL